MQFEIEAKFRVTSLDVFDIIRAQEQIAGYKLTDRQMMLQRDTYFDTAAGVLFHQGASLRLREKEGECRVTFKSQIDGNLVRREFETSVTGAQLDAIFNGNLANVNVEPVQAAMRELGAQAICPVLHVENTRETWRVHSEAAHVKLCFDNVRYTTPTEGQCQYIEEYELELEVLKAGHEPFLQKIVQALSQQFELIPNLASKYERGISLFNVFAMTVNGASN